MKKEIRICDRCGSNIEDTINDLSIVDIHSSPLNIERLRVELCECCIDDLMQFLYGYELTDIRVCRPFPGSDLAKQEVSENVGMTFVDKIILHRNTAGDTE